MPRVDPLRRYLGAGFTLGQVTRGRAENLVRDLIEAGEVETTQAREWVESLVSSSRERYEAFISAVREEVRSQLKELGLTNVDELARRVARILDRGQAAARKATKLPVAKGAKKAAPAKKAPVKKATATKRTPVKKAASKKRAPVKKATPGRRAGG